MRLLLDEMLAPAIATALRDRGHDVEAVAADPGAVASSDREIMAIARAQERAVVTNNVRDFRPLHHEAIAPGGPGDFGVVLLPGGYRRTRGDVGRIVEALRAVLIAHPGDDDLAGRELWL